MIPLQAWCVPGGGYRYSSTFPKTAALEGAEWSAERPGRTLPPGKTRYPFYRRLGGPHDRSGRAENLVPTGIRSKKGVSTDNYTARTLLYQEFEKHI